MKYLLSKTDALSGADNHDAETHMIVIRLLQNLRNEMAEDETLEILNDMTEVIHHQHHKQSPDTTARLLFADFSSVLHPLLSL